jgi:hypothetical protein
MGGRKSSEMGVELKKTNLDGDSSVRLMTTESLCSLLNDIGSSQWLNHLYQKV